MTDCQDQGVSFGLTPQQEMEIVRNTIGLAQMSDFLERIRGQQARIEQLEAEAQAAAAQSARQCRELLRAEGEIAMAYERGYEDAVRVMLAEGDG